MRLFVALLFVVLAGLPARAAQYLVFNSQAAAQAFSQNACTAMGCDGTTTKYWWAITPNGANGQWAVVVADDAQSAFGTNMIPPGARAQLQTKAQMDAAGWVWPVATDPGGGGPVTVVPNAPTGVQVPAAAAVSTPVTLGGLIVHVPTGGVAVGP